jgi:hypothetical protein
MTFNFLKIAKASFCTPKSTFSTRPEGRDYHAEGAVPPQAGRYRD